MQLTLTDTQLKKQPLEYAEKTVTLYQSLLNFLQYQNIPFKDSKGLISVSPENEAQAEAVKRYFATRKINYTVNNDGK
jgi:hypothetical protein